MLAEPSGDLFNLDLGHEVEVEFGPQLGQRCRENLGPLVGRLVVVQLVGDLGVDELGQR